jgi:hypothetical protein
LIATVKEMPGREVRVGIYTSMRADCTAGPLPAIRLSVAPEHGTVTVRRATLKATNAPWSRSIGLKQIPATRIGLNGGELHRRPQTNPALSRHHFECGQRRTADLEPDH